MLRLFCLFRNTGSPLFQIVAIMLWLALAGSTPAQNIATVLWHTDTGGNVLAYSGDGQLLLAGTRLFDANTGAFLRTFVLPYNGGGPNSVAFSPDREYAAVGIQAYNQNLDLFRV